MLSFAQMGGTIGRALALAVTMLAVVPSPTAHADDLRHLQAAFDTVLGSQVRPAPVYASPLEAQLASVSNPAMGRIGVAALDLSSGRSVSVLGDQPFPLASTSKIAIVATYLDGVEQGRFSLADRFAMKVPVPSHKFEGPVAPVRDGEILSAQSLIELAITRSDNHATDALLAAVGGPDAVNRWLRKAGISDFRIDRDIATLVRDDGAVNPATTIDTRDAVTPRAMVRLLTGLHQGQFLNAASRAYLLGVMERTVTGTRRIRAGLPQDARLAHKTGTLSNTSSDVGIIELPDGRAIAVAIYVTGQGSKLDRESRIALIARTLYEGYRAHGATQPQVAGQAQGMQLATASR